MSLHTFEGEPALEAEAAIDRITVAAHNHARQRPKALTAREALLALEFEATFVLICSRMLQDDQRLTEEDHARLVTAVGRVCVVVNEITR